MKKQRSILAGVLAILVVGVISVVSALSGGKVSNNGRAPTSALVGDHVKDFSLGGLDGGTIKAPWESGHPSVLVFFASYCVPCQGEMPKIAEYIRTHSSLRVTVLGIDAIDERGAAQAMIKRDDVTFPVAFDPNGIVTTGVFGFGQVPESVFVNSTGVVEQVYYGAIPQQHLAQGIKTLRSTHA